MGMKVHLIDGTYELFRSHFAMPSMEGADGQEVGAVRGFIQSMLALIRTEEVTHVGCAFDHEIRSFRNELFAGYKTGEGVEEELLEQFPLAEEAAAALGMTVWPMIEFEADDAIATAAARALSHPEVGAGGYLHAGQGPGADGAGEQGGVFRPAEGDDYR